MRAAIAGTGLSPGPRRPCLRRAKTRCIGVVMTDAGQAGLEQVIRRRRAGGLRFWLSSPPGQSSEDGEHELTSINGLFARRVGGLLKGGGTSNHVRSDSDCDCNVYRSSPQP